MWLRQAHWLAALPPALAVAATILFSTAYAAQAIWRHAALGTNALDLGYEDQVLWNTVQGRPFQFSLLSGGGFSLEYQAPLGHAASSLLAYHAELLLAPLSLLYAVLPDVRALLALQAAVVCGGALVAYAYARRRLGNAWAGWAIALAYLSSPFLAAELLSDFHAVALDSALVLVLFLLLERRWIVPALVTGLAIAAAKEDAPVLLTLIGGWTILHEGRRRVGALLLLIGLAFVALDFGVLLPHFSAGQGSPFLARYGYLGATPRAMVATLLHHPGVLTTTLGSPESRSYLLTFLGASGALALLSPLTLAIAAPSLAVNLLSSFPWMRSGMAHYSALVLPVLTVATVEGVRNGERLAQRLAEARSRRRTNDVVCGGASLRAPRRGAVALLLALVVLASAIATPPALGAGFGAGAFAPPQVDAHARLLPRFLAQIPAGDPVSASSALAPHLSHRRDLYLFPNVLDAKEVLLDLTANPFPLSWSDQRSHLLTLLAGGYGVVDAADGYVLLRRGADGLTLPSAALSFAVAPPEVAAKPPLATFGGSLTLLDATTRARYVLGSGWQETLTLDWRTDRSLAEDATLAVWIGGQPQPVPPDFAGSVPALLWRPTSSWRMGEVIRVVVPALPVRRPESLQVGWFFPGSGDQGVQWLACVEATGHVCPLGSHLVLPSSSTRDATYGPDPLNWST